MQRIKPEEARIGMYVHAFEGAWIRHPFWRPRFLISSEADLARIRGADVPAIIIDDTRGVGLTAGDGIGVPVPQPSTPAAIRAVARPSLSGEPALLDDRAVAMRVMTRSKKVMKHVFDGARLGRAVQSEAVIAVVEEISASVLRNPHALIGVTRLKSKHEYTYLHSVAVCALMINLARELGLEEAEVRELGLAGLLHDIGKMAVPEAILDKPGALDDAEFAQVRDHPEQGHRLLSEGEGVPRAALDVCLHHHEKLDGTGYPFGLTGDAIGLAARMGAICDVYDALTSHRAYKQAWKPVEAIAAMAGWDGHFDPALLFRFMQSILVFPVGMMVRLRSNRLAIVMEPGRRTTQPRVRAFYSTVEMGLLRPQDVTISQSFTDDQIVSQEHPDAWGLLGWEALREELMAARKVA